MYVCVCVCMHVCVCVFCVCVCTRPCVGCLFFGSQKLAHSAVNAVIHG